MWNMKRYALNILMQLTFYSCSLSKQELVSFYPSSRSKFMLYLQIYNSFYFFVWNQEYVALICNNEHQNEEKEIFPDNLKSSFSTFSCTKFKI